MVNKLPTAEEWLEHFEENAYPGIPLSECMIDFAKMHVEAALKEASKNVKLSKAFDYGKYDEKTAKFEPIDKKVEVRESYGHGDCGYTAIKVDTESILNSYSLDNIK